MTTEQLYLFNGLYLILLVVVAIVTRATARRIAGALCGGRAAGVDWESSAWVRRPGGGIK
jgi:hypothetical protein